MNIDERTSMINLNHLESIKPITNGNVWCYALKDRVKGCDAVLIKEKQVFFGMYIQKTKGFLPMLLAYDGIVNSRGALYFTIKQLTKAWGS